ncbi:MAG: PqqD family protein [Candidatus Helarchaeota archaeon]
MEQSITNNNEIDLEWIPEYIQKIKDYLYVREEDKTLILRPMKVHHLNDLGVLILKKYLAGATNDEVINEIHAKYQISVDQIKRDIFDFIQRNYFILSYQR